MTKMSYFPNLLFTCTLFFSITGCANNTHTRINKPGITQEEFKRDNYQCIQESRTSWGGGGTGGLGIAMIVSSKISAENESNELYKMCMDARGYTIQEVTEEQMAEEELKLKREVDEVVKQTMLEERQKYEGKTGIISINSNDVLMDDENKLMWPMVGDVEKKQMNWNNANEWAKGFHYAGYNDWRIPTIDELVYLHFYFDKYTNIKDSYYWSSTLYDKDLVKTFNILKYDVTLTLKTNVLSVMPVRSITDLHTGRTTKAPLQ